MRGAPKDEREDQRVEGRQIWMPDWAEEKMTEGRRGCHFTSCTSSCPCSLFTP